MFWSVSGIVEGFVVQGFWTAFWGALIYSILTGLPASPHDKGPTPDSPAPTFV